MNPVWLYRVRNVDQIFVDHGNECDLVFLRQVAKDQLKLLDVLLAIVGRQSNAGQQSFDVGIFERRQYCVEVSAGLGEWQAAKAVVAAKLDNDHRRMQQQD